MPNVIKNTANQEKVKIKYKIECTGFFDIRIPTLDPIINKQNKMYIIVSTIK